MRETNVTIDLHIDTSRFVKAMAKAGRSLHRMRVAPMRSAVRRRHRIRCGICSPRANPKPLCIDGAAYRQRRRRR